MNRRTQTVAQSDPQPVSPARGVLFMVGMLGFFHGLITVVDPML
ncbi:MAG TPA: hypothetical protein VGC46_09490 [Allosphingosinicella sp.]